MTKKTWKESMAQMTADLKDKAKERALEDALEDARTKAYPLKEGWHWLHNSSKSHFFRENGKSLCGRWLTFSASRSREPEAKPPCANCKKLVENHRPVKE